MPRVSVRAIIYMTLSSLCFVLAELISARFIHGISQVQLVWGRYAFHLLFMVTVLGPRYKKKLIATKHLKLHIIRSLTMFVMPFGFILAFAARTPARDVWPVYWLSPLIMLMLSTMVLHERVGIVRWVASVVGFAAILLIYRPDRSILSPVSLLGLASGIAVSLHLMFSRILRDDHPLTSLFHTALWVFVVVTFIVPFFWNPPTLSDIIGIVLIGFVAGFGLLVLARSSELMPLSVVAYFSYTDPVWALILNIVLFGILPGKGELLGALIITAIAIFLLYYETNHAPAYTESAAEVLNPVS